VTTPDSLGHGHHVGGEDEEEGDDAEEAEDVEADEDGSGGPGGEEGFEGVVTHGDVTGAGLGQAARKVSIG
jgi:hypothetical protein